MKIVIFDTETTGLLLPSNSPLEMQPHIIEFYGVAIDEEFKVIQEVEALIYPGQDVTKEITGITGITNADLEGKPEFVDVADEIRSLWENSDLAVAHNIAFDNGMLNNEYMRIAEDLPKARKNLCTVDHLIPVYGYRISLSALYKKLFNKYFKAHRAKHDVFALVKVFHKLVEDKVIDLDLYKD